MPKLKKRYDFVLFFDVQDGNPNGDPDAGNLPRIDAETGMGLVTDVCIKRKIRNFIQITQNGVPGRDIFIKEKAVLNRAIVSAWDEVNENKSLSTADDKRDAEQSAKEKMCEKYFDIRTFGAVLTTSDKEKKDASDEDKKIRKTAGQVRGPIQMTFARSVEPIVSLEHSITRMAVTNERDLEKERTMGRKFTVPYGLYRSHGFISAHLAEQTGFEEADLDLFWQALQNMFEHDRSAARGLMSTRCLLVFEHESALGNKPAYELFDRVSWKRVTEGPARSFDDYQLLLDEEPIKETFKIVHVL
jgi:CRISPR-associated protein Csd2